MKSGLRIAAFAMLGTIALSSQLPETNHNKTCKYFGLRLDKDLNQDSQFSGLRQYLRGKNMKILRRWQKVNLWYLDEKTKESYEERGLSPLVSLRETTQELDDEDFITKNIYDFFDVQLFSNIYIGSEQ